jgi:restriction system protein
MAMPMNKSIEIYLLHEVEMRGGSVAARDPLIYDAVAGHFPPLTEDDRKLVNVATGENKWKNRVDWVRYKLVREGELDGSQRGIWRLTQEGRDRLRNEWPPREQPQYSKKLYTDRASTKTPRRAGGLAPAHSGVTPPSPPSQPAPTPVAAPPLAEPPASVGQASIREEILAKLNSMNDRQFEDFVGHLLAELGYADVEVIGRSGDGGVDVRCVLKGPLVDPPLSVVCQVKRHATNVGPSAVGDLRGRWAHRADRLILVNTAGFTQGAREAAREPGAKEINLVSGEDLADLMIQKGVGVTKEPMVVEKLDEAFFSEFSR